MVRKRFSGGLGFLSPRREGDNYNQRTSRAQECWDTRSSSWSLQRPILLKNPQKTASRSHLMIQAAPTTLHFMVKRFKQLIPVPVWNDHMDIFQDERQGSEQSPQSFRSSVG